MNCPKCGNPLPEGRTICRHCGAKIVRPSKKVARQMAASGRFALACGGLMILLAVVLFIYGDADLFWQIVLIGLGLALIFIGKKMK